MAGVTGKELLSKLKQRYREVEFPADASETLEKVYKFLSDNTVATHNDATHQVLGDYSDWWDSQSTTKGPKLLAISEDYRVEELQGIIATMYQLGAPLTLGEKRTNEFKLLQEIEIRGNKNTEKIMDPEVLVGPKSKFLELIGKVMAELYPSLETLHLFVLDGSGHNLHVGVPETFIRLVWPNIIVDKQRAFSIMDTVLKNLQNTDCAEVKELEKQAKGFSEANSWKACMKDKIYAKQDPIRMVYNDSVSDPPLAKLEQRPLKPLYIYELKQQNGQLDSIEQLNFAGSADDDGLADGLGRKKWVEITSIRQNGGTDLTKWVAPKGHVPRPQMNGESAPNGFAATRGGGQVHMRSINGSPGDKHPARGTKSVIEERTSTVTRLFQGNVQEFVEKMKLKLSEDLGEYKIDEAEKKVIWTHNKSGTKLEFREPNHQATIIGKEGSVRQILAVAEFLTAVPDGYTGAETSSRAFTTRSAYAGTKAPSKIFETASSLGRTKPSSVAAVSISNKPSAASSANGTKKVPYKRKVVEDFEKEDAVELKLQKGEELTVTEDPEAREGELDRWVFGINETTGESGWFPLGYTRDVD